MELTKEDVAQVHAENVGGKRIGLIFDLLDTIAARDAAIEALRAERDNCRTAANGLADELADLRGRMEALRKLAENMLAEHESTGQFAKMDMDEGDKAFTVAAKQFLAVLDAPAGIGYDYVCPTCASGIRSIRYDVRAPESEYKSELCANTWHDAPAGKGDSNG
jgi:hypothetical protein